MIAEEVEMGYNYVLRQIFALRIFVLKGTCIRRMFWVEYANISKQLHAILDPIDHIGWTVA